jgi:hypothetical protein
MSSSLPFNQQDLLSTSQLLQLVLVCVVLIAIWFWAQSKIRTRALVTKGKIYHREALARGVFLHRLALDGTEYRLFESSGQVVLVDKLAVPPELHEFKGNEAITRGDDDSTVGQAGEHHG